MKSFIDLDHLVGAVPFDVVADLRVIDTGRGSEALYRDKLPTLLTSSRRRLRGDPIRLIGDIDRALRRRVLCSASQVDRALAPGAS